MMTDTLIHRRVGEARAGTNRAVIARMKSGWAVVGDHQVVHGYSLLLPDPVVPDLNALSVADRSRFLLDMAALGAKILARKEELKAEMGLEEETEEAGA